jgi:predicted small secreted protein
MKAMKLWNSVMIATAAVAVAMVLAGCPQKEGPAEHAGKQVDKAMDKAGQQIEKAGEKVQDAAKGEDKK